MHTVDERTNRMIRSALAVAQNRLMDLVRNIIGRMA
jgi:hypothetical protein